MGLPLITYRNAGGTSTDHTIFLHPDRPEWIKLNLTAAEIAGLLCRGLSPDETAGKLLSRYGLDPITAAKDVAYVEQQLQMYHMLPPPTPSLDRKPALRSIFLHLTDRCNLSCSHCYVRSGPEKKRELPGSRIIRILDEFEACGGRHISLSGGEPLRHPDIRQIITRAAGWAEVHLLSNGTLITREWAAFLADREVSIQISLDGSTARIHDSVRGSGTFDRVLKAVSLLQEAGMADRITLSTTIMQANHLDLENIIAFARSLGVPEIRFLPLQKTGRADEQWQWIGGVEQKTYENFFTATSFINNRSGISVSCGLSGFLLNIYNKISSDGLWCPLGRSLAIDTGGEIYPCILMMQDEFRLGNIWHHSLADIMKSDQMAEICQALSRRREKIEKCRDCNWRNFCQAGCMAQAKAHKGTIWDVDDFCDYRKRAYEKGFNRILAGT